MSKDDPIGFEVIYFKESLRTWYEIKDISSNKPVFEVNVINSRKPGYYLQDSKGREILALKRISSRSNVYRFFQNDVRYATFSYSTSCCNTNYEIQTKMKTYIGSGFIGSTFQFVSKNGKVSFEVYKGFRGFRNNSTIEVYDSIEPEVAILVAILLDQLALKQQRNRMSDTQLHHRI
ncbi:MAG: hypothetical protein GPJ51_15820 [Candidatus Heimdallarchaeota archaeon]|nr:hypothetical protein [Candidatus Heimdallarchaeota archaeon]